jgi:2-dehydro-3-deoxyphosphogluconate aldolase/(4S)-4-hydroxy-2-oxoglutarate aldolase
MAVMEKTERVAGNIEREAFIVHVRLADTAATVRTINSLLLGGISVIEMPVRTPKWADILQKARAEFGDEITLGITGILDRRSALNAIQAGADYVSSPHTERGIVELCKEENTICMQGALTPNEVYRAQQTGADFVTLMPANFFDQAFVEALLFNYGEVALVPQGGVDDAAAMRFLKSGARAVIIDNWLVNDQLIARRQYDEIQRRAAALKKLQAKRKVS